MAELELYRWPDFMPKPQRSGFTVQVVDRRKTSEMEAGTLIRVEYDYDNIEIQCNLVLNSTQAGWFESFEQKMLRQGTRWFVFPIWVSGEIQYQKVRFKNRPKITQIIGFHTVYQVTLSGEKRDLMDEDIVEALMWFTQEFILDFSNRLHEILHVEAPGFSILPYDLPWYDRRLASVNMQGLEPDTEDVEQSTI